MWQISALTPSLTLASEWVFLSEVPVAGLAAVALESLHVLLASTSARLQATLLVGVGLADAFVQGTLSIAVTCWRKDTIIFIISKRTN